MAQEDAPTIAKSVLSTPMTETQRQLGNAGNFLVADTALQMTPEERYLWAHHVGNLNQGGYAQPEGGYSSLYAMTTSEPGGDPNRVFVVPTIWDNQLLSPDDALKRAMAAGFGKFPSYPTREEADTRYGRMHDYLERDYFKGR